VVLRLVARPAIEPGELPWLGGLALPDTDGEPRRADELVLPGAALLDVLPRTPSAPTPRWPCWPTNRR